MYAIISVYDDTNKSICESRVLLPDSVETTEYSDETYTKHKFSFTVTTSKTYQTMMNGKFKHDDIPEPEVNKWMDQEVENGRRAADDFVDEVLKATDTIKNFCEHQDKCEGCIFNRHVAGSTDHCAILWDTPSEWNFKKEER